MVKCIFCGLVLLYKNRGIGAVSVKNIRDHYVNKHSIDANREALKDYLYYLLEDNHIEFIPLNCYCSEIYFLTPKSLAIHQLREGCDINVNQSGGARVTFFMKFLRRCIEEGRRWFQMKKLMNIILLQRRSVMWKVSKCTTSNMNVK